MRTVLSAFSTPPPPPAAAAASSSASSQVVQPVRVVVGVEHVGGFLAAMPAFVSTPSESASSPLSRALGAKMVSFFSNNAPPTATHHAVILLFHPDTGAPLCVMDGEFITEVAIDTSHLHAHRLNVSCMCVYYMYVPYVEPDCCCHHVCNEKYFGLFDLIVKFVPSQCCVCVCMCVCVL